MKARPRLLFADDQGTIYDHPYFEMAGANGPNIVRPTAGDLVPLPDMSRLYFHLNCPPYGYDPDRKKIVLVTEAKIGRKTLRCHAVSAFIQQGWVRLLLPAMDCSRKDSLLDHGRHSIIEAGVSDFHARCDAHHCGFCNCSGGFFSSQFSCRFCRAACFGALGVC